MKIIKSIGDNKYKIEQTLKGHIDSVYKIIEIKENELISISRDKTMKIWILNKDNKFENITNIYFQNSMSVCNILKLNEKEFITSSYDDKYIKFWNIKNYSNIITIYNINSSRSYKNMCLLDDDLLCIGGDYSNGYYLIKISTHQLIKNILKPNSIISINECLDGLFLCSINENRYYNLVKYKYENENLEKIIEKVNAHNNHKIYSCIEIDDGTIISGGTDNLIIWSY